MPFYDYCCDTCDLQIEERRSYEERDMAKKCASCNGNLVYKFPVSAAQGYVPFEPYYDESLDLDIHGLRHKQEVMKAMGVIEAGDKVHGARNFEEDNPEAIKPISKLSGKTLDDHRREADRREKERSNFVVGDEKGNYTKAEDLPE